MIAQCLHSVSYDTISIYLFLSLCLTTSNPLLMLPFTVFHASLSIQWSFQGRKLPLQVTAAGKSQISPATFTNSTVHECFRADSTLHSEVSKCYRVTHVSNYACYELSLHWGLHATSYCDTH